MELKVETFEWRWLNFILSNLMMAIWSDASRKSLFGDGNETAYKTGDDDEHNFNEE
jgi:hypothetical protein